MFESGAEALVNPVNCVGVMGKGLALEFRRLFPENYLKYKDDCAFGNYRPGLVGFYEYREGRPRYILNVATKDHWRQASQLVDIQRGLAVLDIYIQVFHITSAAIPALGCGLGGLKWARVRPEIERALEHLDDVSIYVYQPKE